MGTPEQKANRQAAAARQELIDQAKARGQIRNDTDLANFIASIGGNPSGPQYRQNYSGGGYSLYGPSWDPGWNFDFEHGQKIPWMGPGETWYDPSKAENWQDTDPLQKARMGGFFKWRDENMDMIDRDWGGNASAAWYALRAKSNMPNSPDMAWWNEGNRGVAPTTTAKPVTSTAPAPVTPAKPVAPVPQKPIDPALTGATTGVSTGVSPYGIFNTNVGTPPVTASRRRTASVPWETTWKY